MSEITIWEREDYEVTAKPIGGDEAIVKVDGNPLVYIRECDIWNFKEELTALLEKYAI